MLANDKAVIEDIGYNLGTWAHNNRYLQEIRNRFCCIRRANHVVITKTKRGNIWEEKHKIKDYKPLPAARTVKNKFLTVL